MGSPVPKPASQRRRRNAVPHTAHVPSQVGKVGVPAPPPRTSWRPEVTQWYAGLIESPQSAVYTASDWQTAMVCCDLLETFYGTGNAAIMAQYGRLAASIGVARADRLRARIEIGEESDKHSGDVGRATVADYKARLGLVRDPS